MRIILTTVGTSLLNNSKRNLKIIDGFPSDPQVSNFLHQTDEVKSSAETNSLLRILKEGDSIIFFCSETIEGKYCAEALKRYYLSMGYKAEIHPVNDLLYTSSRFKMRGIRSLVAALIDEIKTARKKGHTVAINATGGFKAEIAYATLVGLLFDVPVFYIHELFNEIIEMPPTPIAWDVSLIAANDGFFEWIFQDERSTAEVDTRLTGLPSDLHLLLMEEEREGKHFTLLSPTGEAFYESYLDILEQAKDDILLSETAKKSYRNASPSVQALYDRTLSKLRSRVLRNSGCELLPAEKSDCRIYPQGHRDERSFYIEDVEKHCVFVCELARHSDKSYENLIDRGVWQKRYDGFDYYPQCVV